MTNHRTSLANLRRSDVDPKTFFELAREIDRAEAFAACCEGFRAWVRAGLPGDDPFSIFHASATSGNASGEQATSAPRRKRR